MKPSLIERVVEPGAISAMFQPIYEIGAAQPALCAVEGLARGPRGCTLEAPDILFEYARRKHEESVVDRAAISAILREARKLPETLPVHLNVHASTLGRDERFVEFLAKTSAAEGVSLGRLVLEVLEHSNFVEEQSFLSTLAEMRKLGCEIALDDVGVGNSNFRMMLVTRPSLLKIDRYLVNGIASDAYQQATMNAIRLLADQVHAKLVAEGVETAEDLHALKSLGVEQVQGFFLSRPCTADDLVSSGALVTFFDSDRLLDLEAVSLAS